MSGDIDVIVGFVSPTVTLPPKDTGLPLIVIVLLSKAPFGILVKDAPLPENVVAVAVPVIFTFPVPVISFEFKSKLPPNCGEPS